MSDKNKDSYDVITKIVLEEMQIDITDTEPDVYVPAIAAAMVSLKAKACNRKEGRGCV